MTSVALRHILIWLNHKHLEIVLANILPCFYESLLHLPLVHMLAHEQGVLMLEYERVLHPAHNMHINLDRIKVVKGNFLLLLRFSKSWCCLLLEVLVNGDLWPATVQTYKSQPVLMGKKVKVSIALDSKLQFH